MASSRTSKSALFRLLQQSKMPIYAVNESMKIVFCNEALCEWAGLSDEELTELTCVWQTATDQPPSRQTAAGLCPPPDCFEGLPVQGMVSVPNRNLTGSDSRKGSSEFRQATFVPANLENGEEEKASGGVLVFVHGLVVENVSSANQADFNPIHLHSAIAKMQFESTSAINIDRIVGTSAQAQKVRRQVSIAGSVATNVVIVGPRGSGRKSLGPLIHFANGYESAGALIPIQCAVCDLESLQETIKSLYRTRKQHPDEPLGRIFLQDVEQLSPTAQDELLGFLKLPDFGLVCLATAEQGMLDRIKPELWQALSTMVVELPKLSERRQDIPYIAQAVVEQFNQSGHLQRQGIHPDVMAQLARYGWPGELDELIEVVDHAAANAEGAVIQLADFPAQTRIALRSLAMSDSSIESKDTIQLDEFLAEIEEQMIQRALRFAGGNKSEASRLLGISRARLLRRLDGLNGRSAEDDVVQFEEVDQAGGGDEL